jgi:hypothetical protein
MHTRSTVENGDDTNGSLSAIESYSTVPPFPAGPDMNFNTGGLNSRAMHIYSGVLFLPTSATHHIINRRENGGAERKILPLKSQRG